jgi:two-component system OmpR family response regulator
MTAIEVALERGEAERLGAVPSPACARDRRYVFAGWSLDAATRDLVRSSGARVDLTSSEFDLLMAFVHAPAEPLSRAALLRAVRGRTCR